MPLATAGMFMMTVERKSFCSVSASGVLQVLICAHFFLFFFHLSIIQNTNLNVEVYAQEYVERWGGMLTYADVC